MTTALFINSPSPACGVFQFGMNLHRILAPSSKVKWAYCEAKSPEQLQLAVKAVAPDVCVVNHQEGIGGFMNQAPFYWMGKSVFVFHDLGFNEAAYEAVLFSDPTMTESGKWKKIGRPLPQFKYYSTPNNPVVTIGCYGLVGAWADRVVGRVVDEFEYAHVRLLMPFATYGDADGLTAKAMADRCRALVKGKYVTLEISHDFLPQPELLEWLSQNDINCYFRDVAVGWRGVSSAPDCALAVRRPIAVNRCTAFRHLHGLSPSIEIEDSSLTQIISNGLNPLVPLLQKWDAQTVRNDVDKVILSL